MAFDLCAYVLNDTTNDVDPLGLTKKKGRQLHRELTAMNSAKAELGEAATKAFAMRILAMAEQIVGQLA